jgi:polyhydroxyalkanoate synthesis regulator phasin
MNLVYDIEGIDLGDFINHQLYNKEWLYVIFANPQNSSKAAERILNNFDYYDRRSGSEVHFFMPGYIRHKSKVFNHFTSSYLSYDDVKHSLIKTDRLGAICFKTAGFVDSINYIESESRYHYSGECDLLLLKINTIDKCIDYTNVYDYNLDDIVRNNEAIEAFIEKVILFSKDSASEIFEIKRNIDQCFYKMIIPKNEITAVDNYEREDINSSLKPNSIFISYSTKNSIQAFKIKELLETENMNVWIAPNDIPQGISYAYVIRAAIENASHFLLLLSKDSSQSIWVEKELDRAINLRCPIIVVTMNDIDIKNLPYSFDYYLCNIQCKLNVNDVIKIPDHLIKNITGNYVGESEENASALNKILFFKSKNKCTNLDDDKNRENIKHMNSSEHLKIIEQKSTIDFLNKQIELLEKELLSIRNDSSRDRFDDDNVSFDTEALEIIKRSCYGLRNYITSIASVVNQYNGGMDELKQNIQKLYNDQDCDFLFHRLHNCSLDDRSRGFIQMLSYSICDIQKSIIKLIDNIESTRQYSSILNRNNGTSDDYIGKLKTFEDGSNGIVFFVDDRCHGLAVSMYGTPQKWEDVDDQNSCHKITKIQLDTVCNRILEVGLGKLYTNYAIEQLGIDYLPAMKFCKSFGEEWYLPSVGELWQLLTVANERKAENGIVSKALYANGGDALEYSYPYLSSSECSFSKIWAIYDEKSHPIEASKKESYYPIRAIRMF